MRRFRAFCAAAILIVSTSTGMAAEPSVEQIEFFETKVRPLLVEQCFDCHSSQAKSVKGGLRLDSRAAVVRGDES